MLGDRKMFETFSQNSLLPQTGKIHLVIDSDAKNGVDDQFAIAWAAKSVNRFSLDAVYAAPFSPDCYEHLDQKRPKNRVSERSPRISVDPADGMEQSYKEIKKLFRLMGEPWEGRVFRGARTYLPADDVPVESEAVDDLIRRAKASTERIYVAAIGAATNISSAILRDPAIKEKIVVVWLGGNALGYGQGIEFNLIQDVYAAQILFHSGVPLIWVPCLNVASLLSASEAELRTNLLGTTEIGDYLAKSVLNTFQDPSSEMTRMYLNRSSGLLGNCDEEEEYLQNFSTEFVAWSRIIWDIATIAFLKNPNWTPSRLLPAPVLKSDFRWEMLADKRQCIRVVTHCYRDMIFGDLFHTLSK